MSTLITILVVVALALGGSGATVYAAQDSQPDEPLYGMKLVGEDVQLGLAFKPMSRLELVMRFAEERAEEMTALVQDGKTVPAKVAARWDEEVRTALQLCAQFDEPIMAGELVRVRERLVTQQKIMNKAAESQLKVGDPILTQVQTRLQARINQVDNGIVDGAAFRHMMNASDLLEEAGFGGDQGPWGNEEPVPGVGPGPGDGLPGADGPQNQVGQPEDAGDGIPNGEDGAGNMIQDGNSDGGSANGQNGNNGGDGGGGDGGGNGGK